MSSTQPLVDDHAVAISEVHPVDRPVKSYTPLPKLSRDLNIRMVEGCDWLIANREIIVAAITANDTYTVDRFLRDLDTLKDHNFWAELIGFCSYCQYIIGLYKSN